MFAILLCALLVGEIQENISFDQPIKTKVYVNAEMPNHRIIAVPVVNNFLPMVTEWSDGNTIHRNLDYGCHYLYNGEYIVYHIKQPNEGCQPIKQPELAPPLDPLDPRHSLEELPSDPDLLMPNKDSK